MAKDKTIKMTLEAEDKYSKPLNDFDKKIGKLGKNASLTGISLKGLGASALTVSASITALATAVGVTAVGVYKLADATAEMADGINKASQRMGVSLEFYQKMTSASEHAGTSISTMHTGMRTLVGAMQQVEEGSSNAILAFDKIGVSVYDSNGAMRDQEEIFQETLVALASMENRTERTAIAQRLLGRSSMELAPLLNEGADAVNRYVVENDSAVTVSEEMARSAQEYNDSMLTLREQLTGIKNEAMQPLLEVFSDFATEMMNSEINSAFFVDALEDIADVAEPVLHGIRGILLHYGVLTERQQELSESARNIRRDFSAMTDQEIQNKIAGFNSEIEVLQENFQSVLDSAERRESAGILTGEALRSLTEEAQGYADTADMLKELIDIYEDELTLRARIETIRNRTTEEQTTVLNKYNKEIVRSAKAQKEHNETSWQRIEILDIETSARVEATQKLENELEIRRKIKQEEQDAIQDFINTSVNGAVVVAESFQDMHLSKMKMIKNEFDAEEQAIRDSAQSQYKKEKALQKLAEERKKQEIEAQKRQLAYASAIGFANTALVIQNQMKAITSAGAEAPFGTKTLAMISMLGATAGYVAQVKSAQAMIPKREFGGVVRRGQLYEVAENGKDEIFQSGGKTMLLPSQGGRVVPNNKISNSSNITINASFGSGDMATIERRLPELVAKGIEMADREGRIDYSGMRNFNKAVQGA
jgi:hypothetical protein